MRSFDAFITFTLLACNMSQLCASHDISSFSSERLLYFDDLSFIWLISIGFTIFPFVRTNLSAVNGWSCNKYRPISIVKEKKKYSFLMGYKINQSIFWYSITLRATMDSYVPKIWNSSVIFIIGKEAGLCKILTISMRSKNSTNMGIIFTCSALKIWNESKTDWQKQ